MSYKNQCFENSDSTWIKPEGNPLFLLIDGSNFYCEGTAWYDTGYKSNKGKPVKNPISPQLKRVEAVVAFCLRQNIAFHLYFDSPAPYHFKDDEKRLDSVGLEARFNRLRYLAIAGKNSLTSVIKGAQADPYMLRAARDWNSLGYESYIITTDKFSQKEFVEYVDVLGKRDERGWPERVLLGNTSPLPNDRLKLVFMGFPGSVSAGFFSIPIENSLESDELNRLLKDYNTVTDSAKASTQAQSPAPAPAPAPAPTPNPSSLPALAPILGPKLFSLNRWPIFIQAESSQAKAGGASTEIKPDGSWSMLLGRDDKTNHARLHCVVDKSLEFVSGQHLRLDHDGPTGTVTVTDMSTNGTWLGESKLVKDAPTQMRSAGGILTLSGSTEQPGAVSLMFNLSNISYDSADESGQTVRVETKARMMQRQETHQRMAKTPVPGPGEPAPAQPTPDPVGNGELTLHIEYPNGTVGSCWIDTRKLPFYIGSIVTEFNQGTRLTPQIAPGIAPTHLVIKSVQHDRRTKRIRAVDAECASMRAGYSIDGHLSDDPEFVWNVGDDGADNGNLVMLTPNGNQFAAKLWLTAA